MDWAQQSMDWAQQSVMYGQNSPYTPEQRHQNFISTTTAYAKSFGYNCHLIEISRRDDYEQIKHLFDLQASNFEDPFGRFEWGLPNHGDLGHLVIFSDSIRGVKYLTRIFAIKPMDPESEFAFLSTHLIYCGKP